jgi:hypothetical protein
MIDNLLGCELIKELGCVYLVLKIYEELFTYLHNYIEVAKKYIKSKTDVQQLTLMYVGFETKHPQIKKDIDERLTLLNNILLSYINIWLYYTFNPINSAGISYNLNDVIENFIRHGDDGSVLHGLSSQFIILDSATNISNFNTRLFIDNYTFVEQVLRNKDGYIKSYVDDYLHIIKSFHNFPNSMLEHTEKRPQSPLQNYRTRDSNDGIISAAMVDLSLGESDACKAISSFLGYKGKIDNTNMCVYFK